ncbi:MAG TPA: polysaccharide deacetylase family protein [Acidimicrobiia bacterium]|nr:polysaccharide deacetylase family protein [Acidimicrobiia bacterium]
MNAVRVAAKAVLATADIFLPRLPGPRILIYHQVGSGRTHEMNVTLDAFRRQLDWLQTNGEIVGLDEGIKRRGDPESHRLFVLTFDDGYADVFECAFPLMSLRGIPFTLYLTSGPIENPREFPDWPGEPLTWQQIRSMIDSGLVTIGAHTHSHPDLRLVSEAAIVKELDWSNALIAEHTGIFPAHFTYPKGWWAPQAHPAVCERYETATLGGGEMITSLTDLHLLHRLPVQRSDIGLLFGLKMRSGGRTEHRVRRYLRGNFET